MELIQVFCLHKRKQRLQGKHLHPLTANSRKASAISRFSFKEPRIIQSSPSDQICNTENFLFCCFFLCKVIFTSWAKLFIQVPELKYSCFTCKLDNPRHQINKTMVLNQAENGFVVLRSLFK